MNGEQTIIAPPQGNGFGDFAYEPQPQHAPQVIEKPKNKRTMVLRIYEDENGKKYIDAPALTSMKGLEPSYTYKYPDGQIISVSPSILRDKPAGEIPEGYISSDTTYPDFSNEYPLNPELGMYEVTDADVAALVALYESMYPDVEVIVEIMKISSKDFNKADDPDKDLYDQMKELVERQDNNIKENHDISQDFIENTQNKEYQPNDMNNRDQSDLAKMLEEENQNKDYTQFKM